MTNLYSGHSFIISCWEMRWFLHVGHKERNKLRNVAGRLEGASVVGEFLQHLETLKYKQYNK